MRIIDTHAHIYLKEFSDDLSATVDRAKNEGVERIYMPNVDHTTIEDMLDVADKYKGYCIPMIGLHPCSVAKDFEKELYIVESWLSKGGFAAVGEIGTDLYWDKTFWNAQKEAFKIQAELAKNYNMPVVIHCRETIEETINLVKETNSTNGVFHCFTGSLEQADKIIKQGFQLGIGGVATFKNGGLEPVLAKVDLNNIVLETDSPYLAPVPFRGKRNEPSYLKHVVQKIADVGKIKSDKVEEITTKNALKLFDNAK